MSKKRLLGILATATVAVGGAAAAVLPMTASNAAAACAAPYSGSQVYTGGMTASYNGHNWRAKWWTQNETPGAGGSGVWADDGGCSGGNPGNGGSHCEHPDWAAGQWYGAGSIVRYPGNGQYYQASHDNPGYDPTISTWYWSPVDCSGGGGNPGGGNPGGGDPGGFVVSEAQFNRMFPSRNGFYTYAGLTDAMRKYPAFATSGDDATRKREAAAFLANVGHETSGLIHIDEVDTSGWGTYCDRGRPYGCPAGQTAYHGRGPIQLSWNYNYKAAGDALGVDLLDNPNLVASDSSVSWQTGLWYWMTGTGGAGTTSHDAMVGGRGFGTTIRAINGIECNGGAPDKMQSRVNLYNSFSSILGVSPGGNLTC
jgi:predicted chitinase/chitodextrinase